MRKFGDLSPEEKRAAIGVAARQLEAELNHPAMVEALSVPEEHTITYRTLRQDTGTVAAVCSCLLTAVSASREGVDRVMRRKHKEQARRVRARERARG